jgi:hypothetical protein
MVEPGSHYYLNFMAKSEGLVTGGLPVVRIADPGESAKILGESPTITPTMRGWTALQIDFSTTQSTRAIIVDIRRLTCAQSLCPAFGTVWLSGFSLVKK